jgi:3',5'-nucleoside bisphosphate phosphatase
MDKQPIYDLHVHSHWSDGTLSPPDVVARAAANGVAWMALTDHDVTDGLPEAMEAGERLGVGIIPGVEISVSWQHQTLHVLGLAIDVRNQVLQDGLARLRVARDERAVEIGRRLGKKNVHGAYAYVREQVHGPILSRTHFAQFLIERGYVRDMKQAFKQYLGQGCAGHVAGKWSSLQETIGWIREAGGIAVLAHPGRYRVSSGGLKRLLAEFIDCGGRGIEVISGSHGPEDTARFARIAADYGLLASAGSDYHGPEKPWIDIGRLSALPDFVQPVWTAFNECAASFPKASDPSLHTKNQ